MSEPEGSGVFVSYRRQDTSGVAGRLADRLAERLGASRVFMDVDTIEPGVDFTQAIARAVETCEVLLAIIGPGWLIATDELGHRRLDDSNDIVRVEIEAALTRKVRVIPVLVENAVMPRRENLPESLASLAYRHAFIVRHESFRYDAERLVAAIEDAIGDRSREEQESIFQPESHPKGSSTGQGKWRLELITGGRFKKTFRLSSGQETHQITVKYGKVVETIEVDGKNVVRTSSLNGTVYPLDELSWNIGSAITILVIQKSFRWAEMESLVLKIGDQVLMYKA